MYKKVLIFTFGLLLTFVSASAQSRRVPRFHNFDVQHYKIQIDFDRTEKRIFGDTTVTFKPLAKNFKTLELDADGMKFSSVSLKPSGKNLKYDVKDKKIIINLDKSYNRKDVISVNFKYTAKPDKGIYFIKEKTENNEIKLHAQVWTQGEPEEAHYWFPSYDFPDDKATSEQIISADAGETVIANGKLISQKRNPNGTTSFHYKMDIPHSTYLTSFVVGTYEKIGDNYKNIPLNYYVYQGITPLGKSVFGKTPQMFRVFEELTGIAYPYNRYDQTMVANFSFGGMENITATTISDEAVFFSITNQLIVEDLVAHELAHSWFGNYVTCKNWSELWLNEGFATFMEAAYREKMYGRENYVRKIVEDAEVFKTDFAVGRGKHGLFNLTANPEKDKTLFNKTNYEKGSAVIHTLREEIGDEAFWKAINIYLDRHKFANVETADLQKVMEETSGKNLDWFFKQWIYGGGYPKITVKKSFDESANLLTLKFVQTQKDDRITPEVFILPLEIEIKTPNKTQTEKIEMNQREQTFTFKLDGVALDVSVDKNIKIPLKSVDTE